MFQRETRKGCRRRWNSVKNVCRHAWGKNCSSNHMGAKKATASKSTPVQKFLREVVEQAKDGIIRVSEVSPICLRCGLNKCGARHPYLKFSGPDDPVVTVVFDSVSRREDDAGVIASSGSANGLFKKVLEEEARKLGFDANQVRYIATTRCANRGEKKVNYKTHGRWCRYSAVQDLRRHPPKLVIAVGSTALGMLCHKSNAGNWAGMVLNWRGWPDAWLVDKNFLTGHPFFGPRPTDAERRPLCPVQSPKLVFATRNPAETARWQRHIKRALELAVHGATAPVYTRPWFRLLETPEELENALDLIPTGISLTYDTETTGLLAFASSARIVFMMFRYNLPDGTPMALAFPWDYDDSPLKPHLVRLAPRVLATLYRTKLCGHNLGFDIIYTYATVQDADLHKLTTAMDCDTRHLLYCYKQTKESLGLERVAYDWCSEMAGYEEAFELLKETNPELLDPGKGEGGHYAKCPRELWPTHLMPYVFGDVEVAAVTKERALEKLRLAKSYSIPLSDPNDLGHFRRYKPLHRLQTYQRIMLPGQRFLTRLMGRGMFVDIEELERQEDTFPKMIRSSREELRKIDQRIVQWCESNEATVKDWRLELEDREQLKTILFEILGLPVKRLTKTGIEKFGEELKGVSPEDRLKYAAIDKYTLNGLVAEFPKLKPLQDYRKLYKAYTTYVRAMRNLFTEGIDKKLRGKDQYLMPDYCVHTNFNQCGTRGGRLTSSAPNMQQLPSESIVKRFYTSRFGERGCLYNCDLSQIELRLLAAACGDPLMVKTYRDNTDIHSVTMSKIFKLDYEQCLKEYAADLQKQGKLAEAKKLGLWRRISKTTNFLTGYGGGAYGLQTSLAEDAVYLPFEECERIVEGLFDTYPKLREHIGVYKGFILDTGIAVSMTGRIRIFEDIYSEDKGLVSKALRSGYNHLIQPTASDMMVTCMATIEAAMRYAKLESILVSTVHDSIVIDAVQAELPQIHDIAMEVVNNIPEVLELAWGPEFDSSWTRVVPFSGDAEIGLNYLDLLKVESDPQTKQVDWGALLTRLKSAHA